MYCLWFVYTNANILQEQFTILIVIEFNNNLTLKMEIHIASISP